MFKRMFARQKFSRGMAVFVLAFLCLNLGGALCLTLCNEIFAASTTVAESDAHLSEHCKQAKKAAEERERDSTKIEAGEASCCMMPVSMFAVTVEKRPEFTVVLTAAPLPATVEFDIAAPAFYRSSPSTLPVYRPPPLDRRGERILHSVFRI